ncbi:hypothetical protein OLMES_1292 [Oleiphilus messinensis]|uniref:SH3b domain-containing protein n=1 Tax=Oleiphilus messinensis TaxID=141451 RepID=A0A1Y0I4N3_9GAMM|nr:SH3 domain-containing protein [Oleiphilus messinensis]ARU55371.1 hypothetical protein OLMES_1292 [Oleiphilus messinensis]
MFNLRKSIFTLAMAFPLIACADSDNSIPSPGDVRQDLDVTYLKVRNVKENDTLNLRAAPSAQSQILQKLSHDATGLLKIGEQNQWVQLSYFGVQGWVHGNYVDQATRPVLKGGASEVSCLGTEPHWNFNSRYPVVEFKYLGDSVSLWLDGPITEGQNATNIELLSASHPKALEKSLQAVVKTELCSDGMSDRDYPYSIEIISRQHGILSGCCR